MPKNKKMKEHLILTIVVGVAQCPRLVWVKVCVASYSRPWKVGMSQETALTIEGWAVAMEAWSKDDGDVHIFLGPLQFTIGNSFKAQRRHVLPHVKRSANGIVGLLSADFGRHVLYTAETWRERLQQTQQLNPKISNWPRVSFPLMYSYVMCLCWNLTIKSQIRYWIVDAEICLIICVNSNLRWCKMFFVTGKQLIINIPLTTCKSFMGAMSILAFGTRGDVQDSWDFL